MEEAGLPLIRSIGYVLNAVHQPVIVLDGWRLHPIMDSLVIAFLLLSQHVLIVPSLPETKQLHRTALLICTDKLSLIRNFQLSWGHYYSGTEVVIF